MDTYANSRQTIQLILKETIVKKILFENCALWLSQPNLIKK